MKKTWKYRWKSVLGLLLLAILLGSGMERMSLSVQAKGIYGPDEEKGQSRTGGSSDVTEEDRMTEDEQRIYNALQTMAQRIASGQRSSSVVTVGSLASVFDSEQEIGDMITRTLSYLLMDHPYEFYWYDKRGGCNYSWTPEEDGRVLRITISMAVAEEYQDSNKFAADTVKTTEAKNAMRKAQAIVRKYQNMSDYNKLKGYMTEICDLVSYNWDAYEDETTPYGNPWQLIWVFDEDPDTNVVCEGYAKAFQYLCDLSSFRDAECYTVEGAMSGGTGSGGHMWNIVTLEGDSYLVDVTNCDKDAVGAPDQLFLAGTEGTIRDGYTFSLNQGNNSITYEYGNNQFDLLGGVLDLSPYSYLDPSKLKLEVTAPTAEVIFGDPVDNQALTGGVVVNGDKEEVPGTFAWADEVNFYGEAGTNTLNAVFIPESPQYQTVENIRVKVTVQRRPVTVTADAKSKVYGQQDPELTYAYSNVISGYPLNGQLTRKAGENVGTYAIVQGDLTDSRNPNYTIHFTGSNLEITPEINNTLEFFVGNERASAANAVSLKGDPVYGDLWSDIVTIGSITAKAGSGSDNNQGHFTLQESGAPGVGSGQSFHVLYNGTIGGRSYRNELVCEGTVDVKRRVLTVSAGSYRVSKAYDKTREGGTATGQLALDNLLAADTNRIQVTGVPTGYTDPNVRNQSQMTVNLTLNGAAANNYELGNNTVEVPCEITPKAITPTVKVSGNYTYTGRGITPTLTVSDGKDVLAATDYDMVLSSNTNAGTAKVTVRPHSGGNYTWNPAIETSFTIDKADYKGTKASSTSMEYGGAAVFSMYSMLSEGYKLGEMRVSDPDKIFAETPAVSGTVLSGKLVNDRSKEGKTAVITIPVTESVNYNPYELTFTVTMAAQRAGANDNNQGDKAPFSGSEGGTGQNFVKPPSSVTDIQDGRSPGGDDGAETGPAGSANVTALDRENSKTARSKGIGTEPIVWGAVGGILTLGVCGGVYLIRRRRKIEK